MSSGSAVSIRKLHKSFPQNDGSQLQVLRDINLDVDENNFVALIGYSGCGKTTLLRMICGFEKIDKGCVLIDGKEYVKPTKNVLMIFQDFNQLLPWRTVLGNIVSPLLTTKIMKNKKEARECAFDYLEEVELSKFATSFPHQLSGGMKQRAVVARSLALQPRVLLMDEPFAALDNITRNSLQILTRRVCEKHGVTALIVTHSVEEAVIMTNKIVVMSTNPGCIIKIFDNDNLNRQDEKARAAISGEIIKLLDENKPKKIGEKDAVFARESES